MTAVEDRLAEIEARAGAATEGPWKVWGMEVLADPVGNSNLDDGIPVADTLMRDARGKPRTFDADFIAAARTDVPALTAALRAVLALHRPIWCNALNDYQCVECGADLTDATPNCPTVAIIAALGEDGAL